MPDQAPQKYNECCPLCKSHGAELFHQDNNKRTQRPYYRCSTCLLVFVPSEFFLTKEAEKAEYDLHENQLEDDGYRRFLSRFLDPLQEKLSPNSRVLDFGCGPGPALAQMMKDLGHEVNLYDYFYFNNPSVLTPKAYDVVTSTEVFEHLHAPKGILEMCLSLVKDGGCLALMTKLVKDQAAFANWHYKNDLTHVVFFSHETFEWLAKHYHLSLEFADQDVIFLSK